METNLIFSCLIQQCLRILTHYWAKLNGACIAFASEFRTSTILHYWIYGIKNYRISIPLSTKTSKKMLSKSTDQFKSY
jgi:hypothetical protein